MDKVNLAEKFALFDGYWKPKIAGELNNQYVKLAKLKGEFVWHHHENEDEFFMVIKGHLTIKLKEKDIELDEGNFKLNTPRDRVRTFSHQLVYKHQTTLTNLGKWRYLQYLYRTFRVCRSTISLPQNSF